MPYFLSNSITDAITTDAQSVSGMKPIFTSFFSGASEPCAHAPARIAGSTSAHQRRRPRLRRAARGGDARCRRRRRRFAPRARRLVRNEFAHRRCSRSRNVMRTHSNEKRRRCRRSRCESPTHSRRRCRIAARPPLAALRLTRRSKIRDPLAALASSMPSRPAAIKPLIRIASIASRLARRRPSDAAAHHARAREPRVAPTQDTRSSFSSAGSRRR